MSDTVAEDWVGCLVLAVAPEPYVHEVSEAVLRAEDKINGDPVLMDMARVATTAADTLDGDLDDIASRLYRELVTWARSPARNPAPRFTFCVLLLDPDADQASRLVRDLAGTSVLSELPILFRTGELPPKADEQADTTHLILESVIATAHELDQVPGFFLTPHQLESIAARHDVPVSNQIDTIATAHVPDAPQTDSPRRASRLRELSDATLTRLAKYPPMVRRQLPAKGIEVINKLTERSDHVSMLYLVFVAEPVRPARQRRKTRVEIAQALAQVLLTQTDDDRPTWYVRTFAAGRELRAGRPLPAPDVLRPRDFPEWWGEHVDLYDRAGDIIENIDRDTSSFMRRGLAPPRTVVVFLSSQPPSGGTDAAHRLTDLQVEAETIWISFGPSAPVPDDFATVGTLFLRHHEDLANELAQLVTEPRTPPSEEPAIQG